MLVAVTFDVDLEPEEIAALKLVIAGYTNKQIAEELGIPIQKLEKNISGLKLEKDLDLVQATRGRLVTWQFER